ncbi:MFS transporter [Vallitalea sp.]|jgi:MFS family permease|uniref:MFS transporter n=1 Tax=Vallitalea sp. TaxID=1882829 RepID=UPI0025E4676F|nr:MFS transporter [Vallitalea sp.]MCT4688868.1 MFS transporter [Vallitalea sp.]
MKSIKDVAGVFISIPRKIQMLLLAIFVTNIGNGIQAIAMSKWLYDYTGSALAYGGVILLDYVLSFLVQFISGALIDKSNPKKVYIFCDIIRGGIFITLSLFLDSSSALIIVSVSVAIVSLINSIYRTCYFKLLPMLVEDSSKLLMINGISSTVIQGGLLLGIAIVAPLLIIGGTKLAIIINAISFFVSALLMWLIKFEYIIEPVKSIKKFNSILSDWYQVFLHIKADSSLLLHLIVSTANVMVVNFFNILLVPMVKTWYHNDSYYISLFDGSFTIGAVIIGIIISKIYGKLGLRSSSWLSLVVQGIIFFLLFINKITYISIALIALLGMTNGYSGLIFQTTLQQRVSHDMKGRIASFKHLLISVISLILIPIVSKCLDLSISLGLICSAIIIGLYGTIACFLNYSNKFGDNYLENQV